MTGQSGHFLAVLPVSVAEVSATLEAAPGVQSGQTIEVAWTGPDNSNDFISIAKPEDKEGKYVTYQYTRRGNTVELRTPAEPGTYELRYVTGQSRRVLARLPVQVE